MPSGALESGTGLGVVLRPTTVATTTRHQWHKAILGTDGWNRWSIGGNIWSKWNDEEDEQFRVGEYRTFGDWNDDYTQTRDASGNAVAANDFARTIFVTTDPAFGLPYTPRKYSSRSSTDESVTAVGGARAEEAAWDAYGRYRSPSRPTAGAVQRF